MKVDVGILNARLVEASGAEREWVRNYLTFFDASARFRKAKPASQFDDLHGTFPAGFASVLARAARQEGFEVDVFDRTTPAEPDPDVDLGWLRDDQKKAVAVALEKRRGVLHLPTSFGKTEVGIGLVLSIDAPWLFLVHRTGLATQTAERFYKRVGDRYGHVGVIGDGAWSEGERFTCATFQSVYAALQRGDRRARELLQRARGLIVDEAHTTPATTFYHVTRAVRNAEIRIGLSGTPMERSDRRSAFTIAALGPVIMRVKTDALIEAGRAARAKIRMVEVHHEEHRMLQPTHAQVYRRNVVLSERRNAAVVHAAVQAEKPGLLFVKDLNHGRILRKALERAGLVVNFISGKAIELQRASAIAALERGALDLIVCTNIFQEGVDIPCLRSVIVAAGGRSSIAALQRLGRGMRIERNAAGVVTKDVFELWDIMDRDDKGWLERAAHDRRRAYAKEGHEVELVVA